MYNPDKYVCNPISRHYQLTSTGPHKDGGYCLGCSCAWLLLTMGIWNFQNCDEFKYVKIFVVFQPLLVKPSTFLGTLHKKKKSKNEVSVNVLCFEGRSFCLKQMEMKKGFLSHPQ